MTTIARLMRWLVLAVAPALALVASIPTAVAQNFGNIPPQTVLGNPSMSAKKPAQPMPFSPERKNYARNANMQLDQLNNGGVFNVAPALDTCAPAAGNGGQQNVINDWLAPVEFMLGPTATGTVTNGSNVITGIAFTGAYAGLNTYTAGVTGNASAGSASYGPRFTGVVGGTFVTAVNSATQVTLNQNQTVATGTYNLTFGGACNPNFESFPLPPVVTSQQIPVTDLPGISHAIQLKVTTASTNTSHQSFLGLAQELYPDDIAWIANGTSQAQTVTIGMWIKSSAAGNVGLSFQSQNGLRQYFGMCALSANAWDFCQVTVPGDTNTAQINCPGPATATAAATWPTAPAAYQQYAIVSVSFELGTDFEGPANTWTCYAGGDSSQTQFTTIPGYTVDVSKALLVQGSALSTDTYAYNFLTSAENLQEGQRMWETSYSLGTPIGASAAYDGMAAFIGATSGTSPAGGTVNFATRKRCLVNQLLLDVYSPITGQKGVAGDLLNDANIPLTVAHLGDAGFTWIATPFTGNFADIGFQWVAHCQPQ